ncbi:hypothetical protein BOQ62_00275 [Chryseobacterium sp. CH21]|uniref:hypothetical protein n=1 Tax=Chryseobacterium sp. CH21 TaxID=713556 RepID=UPI00100C1EA7|nr:hypothetical protein [Chryseobacterium sp. CH21]RXM41425.1 hypothetical protein BOQ62_00275 [Chryseobacterium sp. CH21]
MKIILFPLLLISAVLTAQKRDKLIPFSKTDTIKKLNTEKLPGSFGMKQDQNKRLYKMLVKKPDAIIYLALKEPSKDHSQYKILNAITPEKTQVNPKKLIPSK